MTGSRVPVLLVLLPVALAGCLGGGPTGPATDGTTTTAETTGTTETTTTATEEYDPDYGTQFLSVDPLDDQSRHRELPDNRTVAFMNLTEARQQAFERALDGRVEYGPDERNPFNWNDEDRPLAVRYEGTWYRVQVAIV